MMTFRRARRGNRTPRMRLVLAIVAAVSLGSCSSRTALPAPPSGQGPCATPAELGSTGSAQLERMSTSLGGRPPFSVSLVPTGPVPIRIDTELGFQLSSSTAGYASLYLLDPVYTVQVLAENLALASGSLEYPSSPGFTLQAAAPVGFNRVILLVTRQPFNGFSGDETLTTPVATALNGRTFVEQLNGETSNLPGPSWAADEVCLRIVG